MSYNSQTVYLLNLAFLFVHLAVISHIQQPNKI